MDKVILYEAYDKNGEIYLAVVMPTGNYPLEFVIERDVPKGVPFQIVPRSAIPEDRTFRAAWRAGNVGVDIDMDQARLIHMDRIRAARNEKLLELDNEWMRATGRRLTSEANNDRDWETI